MVLDFALGCAVFKLARLMPALPRRVLIPLSLALVLGGSAIIVLRPFVWPDLPRSSCSAGPVSAIVLGAVTFERIGFGLNSPFLSFLANCTYAIYLTHWFTNIVSEKLVFESSNSILVASLLLVVTPCDHHLSGDLHPSLRRTAGDQISDRPFNPAHRRLFAHRILSERPLDFGAKRVFLSAISAREMKRLDTPCARRARHLTRRGGGQMAPAKGQLGVGGGVPSLDEQRICGSAEPHDGGAIGRAVTNIGDIAQLFPARRTHQVAQLPERRA